MRIKDARQTFVGIWIRRLLEDEPIEVWGGDQLRDFNDVEDVVDALLITSLTDESYGQVFNLGSKEKVSLLELAQLMIDLNGSGKLKIMEFPEDRSKIDIGDYYSSHKKISLLTGWNPERSLSQTLDQTLKFYKSNLAFYR
jgi:UDP-glucose 4-epimerase